ncbi:IclR family transcriptional regulator [Amycolatopsis sp. ATCC 39116]|uniref:IclR family transcriptional regulator n=1 Tax=Amycolatopsis sp. (strain ATCC 39116 / 75iv2) TaxID=385957 RepID=UPI0002629043|nr:IclR family transcriptional regulator [Amycolatopsis sp. ATCC 39116]
MLQTIQRIGPILDLFTPERSEWGVAEVAETLGTPRSSTHALLSTLVDTGLLQCRGRGRYRLGWRVVELSEAMRSGVDLRTCAEPAIQELSREVGETVHLGVWERGKVLYLDKVVAHQQVTVTGARVGSRLDAHCTAIGKVLLAHRDDAEIDRVLAQARLKRLTATTITDPAGLRACLDQVRARQVAFDDGEAVAEVQCVAAPVRDEHGAVVAAVSVTVPATRFRPRSKELRKSVSVAAGKIGRRLSAASAGWRQGVLTRN